MPREVKTLHDARVLDEIVEFKRAHNGNSPTRAILLNTLELTGEDLDGSLSRLYAVGALAVDDTGWIVYGGYYDLGTNVFPTTHILKLLKEK